MHRYFGIEILLILLHDRISFYDRSLVQRESAIIAGSLSRVS